MTTYKPIDGGGNGTTNTDPLPTPTSTFAPDPFAPTPTADPTPNPSPGPPVPQPVVDTTDYSGVDTTTLDGISAASGVDVTDDTKYQTGFKWVMLTPEDVQKSTRFNPPPHAVSRTFPPIAFPRGASYDGMAASSLASKIKGANYQRGFIFQDADTKIVGAKKSDLWGFQFLYNPTTISYSNSTMDGIDWTNTANTQANLLVGNMTANVEILLNRVFDIAMMNNEGGPRAIRRTAKNTSAGYGKLVPYNDLLGLYTRGTEWDLEYLMRVCNGDPVRNPTMANNLPTSDWGFVSGIPVWIRFHANMRWKVVINSISVNHVMFTKDMVPILSQVSLSLTRIPVIGYNADVDGKIFEGYENNTATANPASADNESDGTA